MKSFFAVVALLLVVLLKSVNAQNSGSDDLGKAIDILTKGLQANPKNPLNIDGNFINSFSSSLTNETQQDLFKSFGKNLRTDPDLSYRQVYYDLSRAFNLDPSLAGKSTQFAQTKMQLDAMFDNYDLITNKLANVKGNYEFGYFINDPSLISGLSNITGSYESALAIGMGAELITTITEAIAESKKFKEDYINLAKLSQQSAFLENDTYLGKALIDTYVGIEGGQVINPMYRYDFDNGSSLRVENGILRFVNSEKGIYKNLLRVDRRHDGGFYKSKDGRGAWYSNVIISADDQAFYLFVNEDAITSVQCKDCLKGKVGYIISADNGEVIYSKSGLASVPNEGNCVLKAIYLDDDYGLVNYFVTANNIGGYAIYRSEFKENGSKRTLVSGLDKEKFFVLNGNERKFKDDNSFQESLFNRRIQYAYLFEKDNCTISLFWANLHDEKEPEKKQYAGSVLQIAKDKTYYQDDGMVNELTGIAMDCTGNLFFTGSNGNIGMLASGNYQLDDPSLPSKIRQAMDMRVFDMYDFNIDMDYYLSSHGDLNHAYARTDRYPRVPSLRFTPDQKLLIYTIKDKLYLIDPSDFENVKQYRLSCQPHNFYFTKESGDWVINVEALNAYKFPITKKYSLGKLWQMDPKPLPDKSEVGQNAHADTEAAEPIPGPTSHNNSVPSLAKELKELKELQEQGILTEDEFNAAKRKLLGDTPPQTSPKPNSNVIKFSVGKHSYCAIPASDNRFNGLYKYPGKEARFFEYVEGEPIVELESGQKGKFQFHGTPPVNVTWWLESDCNGNLLVTDGELATRYILVIRFEESSISQSKGDFNRMNLDVYKDGSKITILGERVKTLK